MPPNNNKRKGKSKLNRAAIDEGEDVSPGEATAHGIATIVSSGLVGYLLWPKTIVGCLTFLPAVAIAGKIVAYLALMLFGVLFAAYVKHIWRLPVSPDSTMFVDEANAILFPDSSEARGVAARRSCEVDHLVYACSDLEDGIARMQRLTGVRAARGGRHPAHGTHNALLSLGNGAYLEIIAPDPTRRNAATPTIFGLDQSANMDTLVAFAVHPTPAIKGSTFELIAQSLRLAGCDIGPIGPGRRRAPDGRCLTWRFTSPFHAKQAQPFVIDWGETYSPALTAPVGGKVLKLIVRCSAQDATAIADLHRRIGLVGNGGRIPVMLEKTEGPYQLAAEIVTPGGRKVFLD